LRELRVYDKQGGFLIEIPDDARVTFGYFNPGAATPHGGYQKMTALRIYAAESTKTKESQIAVFLDVSGFRDTALQYDKDAVNDMP
jgi:hypothetical protein